MPLQDCLYGETGHGLCRMEDERTTKQAEQRKTGIIREAVCCGDKSQISIPMRPRGEGGEEGLGLSPPSPISNITRADWRQTSH